MPAAEQILIRRPNGLLLYRNAKSSEGKLREDPAFKFIFGVQGISHYQTKRLPLFLQNEQFAVLNPYTPYQQIRYEQEKIMVEISPALMREVADSISGSIHNELHYASFLREAGESVEVIMFLDNALVQLVILLLKYGINNLSKDLPVSHFQHTTSLLTRSVQAMKESFAEPWTLDQMAEIAGLGKYQFAHLFKETVGVAPYSWLQMYRLVKSQELLLKTNQSILEISMSCGFSSVGAFNQLFKRAYGLSPGAFRSKCK